MSRLEYYPTMTDNELRDLLLLAQKEFNNAPYSYSCIIKEVAAELKLRYRKDIERIHNS